MAAQAPDAETGRALWWAFALGACFSGNGTAIAASANVVAIGIAATRGPPDQLLALHPLRHRRDAAEHRPGVGVRLAALLLSGGAPAVDGRRQFDGARQPLARPRDIAVGADQHGVGQLRMRVDGMHDVGSVDARPARPSPSRTCLRAAVRRARLPSQSTSGIRRPTIRSSPRWCWIGDADAAEAFGHQLAWPRAPG